MVFVAFTPIANLAFRAFDCVDVGGATQYMAADMAVACERTDDGAAWAGEYASARNLATLGIVLYTVGACVDENTTPPLF